jgi:hypothetical protein
MTTTQATPETSQAMLRAIYQARAVMRSVELAAAAQEDGAVNYSDDNGATRWGPAIDFAVQRIANVRDLAMGGPAPDVAWYTPLTMLQALGAALWRGTSDRDGAMDVDELQTAAQACIDALEELAEECATVH